MALDCVAEIEACAICLLYVCDTIAMAAYNSGGAVVIVVEAVAPKCATAVSCNTCCRYALRALCACAFMDVGNMTLAQPAHVWRRGGHHADTCHPCSWLATAAAAGQSTNDECVESTLPGGLKQRYTAAAAAAAAQNPTPARDVLRYLRRPRTSNGLPVSVVGWFGVP